MLSCFLFLEGFYYIGIDKLLGHFVVFCTYCECTVPGMSSFAASYCVHIQAKTVAFTLRMLLTIFLYLFFLKQEASPELEYTSLPRSP